MAGARWDSATNIRFVEAYQHNVCLWDPKNPLYKNREARDAAYRNIIEAMDMELTVKDVISKIRSLRNTYNSEMLKVKKSMTTGTGKLYKSKIPWIESLDFLKNINNCYTKINTDNLEEHGNLLSGDSSSSNAESFNDSNTEHCNSSNRNKRGKTNPLTKAFKALQGSNDECDEFDSFGNLVAKQLRNLPLELALQSEEMILALLRKQRIRVLDYVSTERCAKIRSEGVKQCADEWYEDS